MSMSRNVSSSPTAPRPDPADGRTVVPLNDHGAVYLTLVDEISGAAVGLSPHGRALLRRGLVERFGEVFAARADVVVDELVRLATEPHAA
jgi:hypothetical protein